MPRNLGLIVFDLDGVLHRGTQPLPHAAATLERLYRAGWEVHLVTNNSTLTRTALSSRLHAMALPADTKRLMTSAYASALMLQRLDPRPSRVLVVGTAGLMDELRSAGFDAEIAGTAPWDDARADVVVVGLDPDFTYVKLAAAQRALLSGAFLVAANRDRAYPTHDGVLPGAGPIVAALEAAGNVGATCVGKPEPFMFEEIAQRSMISVPWIAVGDSAESDVVAAHRAGMLAVLVMTGMTSADQLGALGAEARPDAVIASLDELFALPALRSVP